MQFVAPQPFEEAVQKFGERTPIGALLNSTQWRDEVPVALRERAFFSANVESIRFLQRAQDAIKNFLVSARDPDTGALRTGSRAQFVSLMQNFALREGMGPLDPKDKGGLNDITSESRLGLIFDTNVRAAQDFGNWKQGMDPAVLDEFPAQRFIRVRRVRKPRPYHQAALGQVRLKTDIDYWVSLNRDFRVPWGPWGYNSGCDVEDVDRAETERLKLLRKGQAVRPVDKKFNDGLQASLRGIEAAMIEKLKAVFGAQVRITGDTIHWAGQQPPPTPKPPRVRKPTTGPEPEPPAAPQEPQSVAELLVKAKLDPKAERATPEQMQALVAGLKKTSPRQAADVLRSVSVPRSGGYTNITRARITEMVQGLLDFLPRAVADNLPAIDLQVKTSLSGALGDYNKALTRLRLNGTALDGDLTGLRKTLWHEMTHWMHDHGPQAFRDRIRALFSARTDGFKEPLVTLKPWNSPKIKGYEDDFTDRVGDSYAARVYPWEDASNPAGLEIVTRHLEKLALDPVVLASHWNFKSPKTGRFAWREAFLESLHIFFP